MAKKAATEEPPAVPQDGVPAPGAAVARELGIALAVVYGMVKRGDVKNHKEGGWPAGKGLEVDIAEVRAARGTKKTRAPKQRAAKAARTIKVKDPNSGELVSVEVKTRKLPVGTMVSYERGRNATADARANAAKPRYGVGSVLAATGTLTYIDEGDHHQHYNGTQIDNTVFGTDRMSMMLAKGVARIEHPVPVLGMVLLAFITEEKLELAESLETWMTANGLEVHIPEIIDLEEDTYVPVAGQMIEEEEAE